MIPRCTHRSLQLHQSNLKRHDRALRSRYATYIGLLEALSQKKTGNEGELESTIGFRGLGIGFVGNEGTGGKTNTIIYVWTIQQLILPSSFPY